MTLVAAAVVTDAEEGHGWSTGAAVGRGEGLANLVSRLKAVASELTTGLPELADGSSWVQLDAALRALYGALAALRTLDGPAPASRLAASPAGFVSEPPLPVRL